MSFPLNIKFHDTRRSANVEQAIRDQAERLDKFHGRIQHCEVVIDQPHHHQKKGNDFHVRILLTVPGQTLAVTSTASPNGDHESLYGAIRDAFDAAKRKLRQQRLKPREQRVRKAARNGDPGGGAPLPPE
jgi:ribosome-associated translation inhibitor RaiA